LPVKTDDITDHKMHTEYFEITENVANNINRYKKEGRIISVVGTTPCRALESAANEDGFMKPYFGNTDIFIYPGYKYKFVENLITNFHLPKSTLLMLVSALSSRENIFDAYEQAVKDKYRFYSFGDAMFIR
jgi:S-adenosylmethionine:tRNA ribosyltransferase-isomerase